MSISVPFDALSGARKPPRGSASGWAQKTMDPPRPAKDGYEWVWYPKGYWAERQMERQSRSKEPSVSSSTHHQGQTSPIGKWFSWSTRASRSPKGRAAEEAEMEQDYAHGHSNNNTAATSPATTSTYHQVPAHFFPRNNLPQSPYLSESEQVALLQQPADPTLGQSNKYAAGLAASAAAITAARGSLQLPKPDRGSEAFREQVRTTPIVEDVPGYFTQVPIRAPSHSPLPQTEAIDSAPSRLNPPPTPRRNGSVPQGLRKFFTKGPKTQKASTPSQSGRTSKAAARKQRSDPASPSSAKRGNSTFNQRVQVSSSPRSYAAGIPVRVKTPPLKEQTASGKPRSLFIDLKHRFAPEDGFSKSGADSNKAALQPSSPNKSNSKGQQAVRKEWWDKPLKTPVKRAPVLQDSGTTKTTGTTSPQQEVPEATVPSFEFKLPEHLPSSPMCPANPNYKGKGRMVCVYHGRGKQASVDEGAGPVGRWP